MQKIGPKFGFRQNEHLRLKQPEVRTYRETEIERHKEAVLIAKSFACQTLSGKSCSGNKDRLAGIYGTQLRYQLADRQDLTDGNGVYPDRSLACASQSLRNAAQALWESSAVFAVTQHLYDPPRQRQQRRAG